MNGTISNHIYPCYSKNMPTINESLDELVG